MSERTDTAGLLLAAGRGSRMGQPKALVTTGGTTAVAPDFADGISAAELVADRRGGTGRRLGEVRGAIHHDGDRARPGRADVATA